MKKEANSLNRDIKNQLIKCISQIYWHYNKRFKYEDVFRAITYNARTEKGLQSLIKVVKKMSADSSDPKIINLNATIKFLKDLYDS